MTVNDTSESVKIDSQERVLGKTFQTDENSNTIIDKSGLVSTTSFKMDQIGSTNFTTVSTTSTTVVDMPNTTLPFFSIDRTIAVLALLSVQMYVSDATKRVEVYIYVGGDINDNHEVRGMTSNTSLITINAYLLRLITANTPPTSYILKCMWLVTGGIGTVYNRQLSRILFGI